MDGQRDMGDQDADQYVDQQALDPGMGQGGGRRRGGFGGGAVAVAKGLPLWVWVMGALGALVLVTAFLVLGKATGGSSDSTQQVAVTVVATKQAVAPVVKPKVAEKPPEVGAFQPLDLANAPWLGSRQLMLAACLVLVAVLFLVDSVMGGKREIRAFIITILFAVLLLVYGGESPLTATILGILHQVLLFVANLVLKYWQLVAAVVIVAKISSLRRGGLTPIASFFIFLGIFGSLSGNLGELGAVLGFGKTVLLPGEQVLKLAITQRWTEAGFTLTCLALLLVGVVIACIEARWKGALLAVGGVFFYYALRLLVDNQALALAITFGLVLALAVPLKAGKGRRLKVGQGSVSTPLDVASVFSATLAMAIIVLGRA